MNTMQSRCIGSLIRGVFVTRGWAGVGGVFLLGEGIARYPTSNTYTSTTRNYGERLRYARLGKEGRASHCRRFPSQRYKCSGDEAVLMGVRPGRSFSISFVQSYSATAQTVNAVVRRASDRWERMLLGVIKESAVPGLDVGQNPYMPLSQGAGHCTG